MREGREKVGGGRRGRKVTKDERREREGRKCVKEGEGEMKGKKNMKEEIKPEKIGGVREGRKGRK